MSKVWEITRGRKVSWKASRYWWVMTWWENGSVGAQPSGPYFVKDFDQIGKVVVSMPTHAIPIFKGTKDVVDIGTFEIRPENIWARMPADMPPAPPNVHMEFDLKPWEPAAEKPA